jgi:hypothetical protein
MISTWWMRTRVSAEENGKSSVKEEVEAKEMNERT